MLFRSVPYIPVGGVGLLVLIADQIHCTIPVVTTDTLPMGAGGWVQEVVRSPKMVTIATGGGSTIDCPFAESTRRRHTRMDPACGVKTTVGFLLGLYFVPGIPKASLMSSMQARDVHVHHAWPSRCNVSTSSQQDL